jgi:oxygen-independent coproporphyrinogen-3 oxidase
MSSDAFGVYIHIPYCLQRCTYCDFATYEQSKIMPPQSYIQLLQKEIAQTAPAHKQFSHLDTVYFGGGTPSLLDPEHIVSILSCLANEGFSTGPGLKTEITIEINPATITEKKMETYLNAGINRFSVGAQTFDDNLLRSVNREHNAQQTRETLKLLKSFGVNFSFDILFALPGQTVAGLKLDLEEVESFAPPHVSPYCLTVPEGHVLSKHKLQDDTQIEMFETIANFLKTRGYDQYEISNFAKPGFHSRHNSLYWNHASYWGLGLSSHSYADLKPWGVRYWNPNSIGNYEKLILQNEGKKFSVAASQLPDDHQEFLEKNQALTDFCHTRLRTKAGISEIELSSRFGREIAAGLRGALLNMELDGLLIFDKLDHWSLTSQGQLLSNQVFAQLTFLAGEV